eukprot:jgi/Tetstr1/444363/TSEL_032254.t1
MVSAGVFDWHRDKVVGHLKLNNNGKFKCKEKARKAEVAKRSFLASMEGDEIRRASKQARGGTRGLIFDMYAKESIVDYNAPHRAHSTPFITKALDHYFGQKTYQRVKPVDKWRFLRTDNNLWRNASLLSEMLTNRLTETSRLEFMNH